MYDSNRIKEIGAQLLERRLQSLKFSTVEELGDRFPNMSFQKIKELEKQRKISFLFQANDPNLKKYCDSFTITSTGVLTVLLGISILFAGLFSIYYSFKYSEYWVLTSLPLIYFSLSFASPYKKVRKLFFIFSICTLVTSIFIESESLRIILLLFSLANILTNIVRWYIQIRMTKVILSNETAFVQGYLNSSFTIRNEKYKTILMIAPEAVQYLIIKDFEAGLIDWSTL